MIRAAKWAKFLPRVGWEVMVLTASGGPASIVCPAADGEFPGVAVVRTAGSLRRTRDRAIGGHDFGDASSVETSGWRSTLALRAGEVFAIPDECVGWYPSATGAGRRLLRENRVDAILSTSPPETVHLVARSLSAEFRVPWAAELRDPWSDDHYRARGAMRRTLLRRLERGVLCQASALVTPSRQWQADLGRRFPEVPCHAIPHGFDPEDYPALVNRAREFTLTYTGSLHRLHQDPEPLFAALGSLIRDGSISPSRLRVNFFVYGSNLPDIGSAARRHGLGDVVDVHPPLDHRSALAAQQASTVLVLFQWSGAPGIEYVKAYEYLGAGRPMLVVGSGEGAIGELVARTRCGVVAERPREIGEKLLAWYREYERTGTVGVSTDPAAVAAETRLERARSLAAVLDAAITRADERPR
jgi:hypothetical protein